MLEINVIVNVRFGLGFLLALRNYVIFNKASYFIEPGQHGKCPSWLGI
jgi:hypothetical protein